MKKIGILLLCAILVCTSVIYAEELPYKIYELSDGNYHLIEESADLNSSLRRFDELRDSYHDLVLMQDETVLMMEYGIVEFKVNDACTLDLNYTSEDGDTKTINGCYAIDAAYLDTSSDLTSVTFMISGDVGTIAFDDVILHPYASLKVANTRYRVSGGSLYHDIKAQLVEDYVFNSIELGPAPNYLSYEEVYDSYDGHYFYRSFYDMIDDYREDSHQRAINSTSPYYNYYIYLPHRSTTNYSYQDLNTYFSDTLVFNGRLDTYYDFNYDNANDDVNRSQYVDNIDAFFEYQYRYGANAMMMISLSIYESSYGKSYNAFVQNNLFGHAAFDTASERANSRYDTVARSIYSHAKYYISDRYGDPTSGVYNGSFFGDLASGMGVSYSKDPYWGENLASDYYTFDRALGLKDLNNYSLGIIEDEEEIIVYSDEAKTNIKATIKDIDPYSFIILKESDDSYKVQFDGTSNEDLTYDFASDVGYIDKSIVDLLLNPEAIKEDSYHTVTFKIDDTTSTSIKVADGDMPIIDAPTKEGYLFQGFAQDIVPVTEDTIYDLIYDKVRSIALVSSPKTTMALNGVMSLESGILMVTYEDQEGNEDSFDVELNSDMVTNYDLTKEGTQNIIVSYCGMVTSYEIFVDKELYDSKVYLDEKIPEIIDRLKKGEEVDSEEILEVKKAILDTGYVLDNDAIVLFDQILLDRYKEDVNFHISGLRLLSISGMALSLNIEDSYNSGLSLIPDTYYLYSGISGYDDEVYLEKISSAYGFEIVTSFSIYFKKNNELITNDGPFIIELHDDELDTHKVYTVYNVDDDGDVIKCRTTQSADGIQFTTMGDGNFMVLALDSANDYTLEGPTIFNITPDNDGPDTVTMIYIGGFYTSIGLVDVILYVCLMYKEKKTKELWSDYKKYWRAPVSPQEEKPKN